MMTRPYDWHLRVIQLLSVAGIVVAFYLLLFHNGVLVGVCPPSGWEDCGRVSGPDGRYASIGPIPVALVGLLGYAGIFLIVWLKDWWEWLEVNIGPLMVSLTAIAFLFSLGLTALEVFVIRAICRYCVVSAIFITIMLVLAIRYQQAEMRASAET